MAGRASHRDDRVLGDAAAAGRDRECRAARAIRGPTSRMPRWRRPVRWRSIATGICRCGRTRRASIRCARRSPTCWASRSDAITVRHAHGAGCYGHNGADDVAVDAAVIAHADARPLHPRAVAPRGGVRLRAGRHRRCMITLRAALDEAGKPVDWTAEIWSADACAAAEQRRQHADARGAADAAARSATDRSAGGQWRRRHAQRVRRCTTSRRSGWCIIWCCARRCAHRRCAGSARCPTCSRSSASWMSWRSAPGSIRWNTGCRCCPIRARGG